MRADALVYLIAGAWQGIEAGDADGRASRSEIGGGQSTELALRDPFTLAPMPN